MGDTEKIPYTNIIRIAWKKPITSYFEAVILRLQPKIYQRYGCIKLRFSKNVKREVHYLVNLFWHLGLAPGAVTEISEIEFANGTIVKDCYELELRKIGAIVFDDDSEFNDWIEKEWAKIK